jgi:U4/U6.U5 tri-snRNP-associated protein 2
VEKNPTIVNFPVSHIEFGDLLTEEVRAKHKEGTTYDLMANVVHDGSPESGSYKVRSCLGLKLPLPGNLDT